METNNITGNNKELTSYIEKIDKLNSSADKVLRHTPMRSVELSTEALQLSREIGYQKGVSEGLFIIGKASYIIGNFEEAINYLTDSLQISQSEDLKKQQADTLNVIGNVYLNLNNYNVALEYYMRSLDMTRQIEHKTTEAGVLNNIGEIYKYLNNYDAALNYYFQSIKICNIINHQSVKCIALQNIGEVNYRLDNYDKAKEYTERSLVISCEVNDKMIEAACLHQLGKIAFKQNNEEEALNLFFRSLEICKETEERYFIITILIDVHKVLKKKGTTDEAIQYLERALALAYEINSKEMIMRTYSYLAEIHESIGRFDTALQYYKKFHDEERKGLKEELDDKLKNITLQFEMKQSNQEKEIYRLKNVELKEKTDALERKTAELIESYNNMRTISQIGQDITSTLNFEKILELVYKSINNLMPAYTFGIALYDKESGDIEYSLFIENSKRYPGSVNNIRTTKNWAAWCIEHKKEIIVNDVEKEYKNYIQDRIIFFGSKSGSLIYCPLIFEDEVLGVLTVQSLNKNAYSQYNLDTVKALASYIAIAIRNAQKSKALTDLNEKLIVLSNLDGLTEIPNRRYFDEKVEVELESAKVNTYPLSLMLIDVDSFKEYNDNYGHLAGDRCLQEIAKVLNSITIDVQGFAARYGGDEFVIIFPNTSSQAAFHIAETMKDTISELGIENKYSNIENYVTLTFGVSTHFPDENLRVSDLIHSADKALYLAKQKGRNRIETY